MEITGATENETNEGFSINIADNHSGSESNEISDGFAVVQRAVQTTGLLAEKGARCRVVLEFNGIMNESEAKLKNLNEKNT